MYLDTDKKYPKWKLSFIKLKDKHYFSKNKLKFNLFLMFKIFILFVYFNKYEPDTSLATTILYFIRVFMLFFIFIAFIILCYRVIIISFSTIY